MTIYILLIPIIILFYTFFDNRYIDNRVLFLFVVFCFLSILSGFRNINVGTDTKTYQLLFFNEVSGQGSALTTKAPIYALFLKTIGIFTQNFSIVIELNAIVISILMATLIYRMKVNPLYATLLYVVLYYYSYSMNGSRQFIAVVLVAHSVLYLSENKYLLYFVFLFLAIGIHNTAYIGFIFLLIKFINWNKKKTIWLETILVLFALVYNKISNYALSLSSSYNIYSNGNALNLQTTGHSSILFFNIFLLVLFIFFAFHVLKNKEYQTKKNELIMYGYLIGLTVNIVLYNVILMQRLMMYFMFLGIYIFSIFPEVLNKSSKEKKYKLIIFICILALLFVPYFFQLKQNNNGIVPYIAAFN